jgi:hypothetical protein
MKRWSKVGDYCTDGWEEGQKLAGYVVSGELAGHYLKKGTWLEGDQLAVMRSYLYF